MNITITDITDINFDGINRADAPDFADSYIESAWNKKEGRPCTEAELDHLQDNFATDIDFIRSEQMN